APAAGPAPAAPPEGDLGKSHAVARDSLRPSQRAAPHRLGQLAQIAIARPQRRAQDMRDLDALGWGQLAQERGPDGGREAGARGAVPAGKLPEVQLVQGLCGRKRDYHTVYAFGALPAQHGARDCPATQEGYPLPRPPTRMPLLTPWKAGTGQRS